MIVVLAKKKRVNRRKKITTAFLLVVKDGRALIVKRSSRVRNSGLWGLPGGHIDKGETPKQAVRRECLEEIGLDPQVKVVQKFKVQRRRGRSLVFLTRSKRAASWGIVLNDEHTEYKWVRPRWLKRNMNKLHPALKFLLRRKSAWTALVDLCEETAE